MFKMLAYCKYSLVKTSNVLNGELKSNKTYRLSLVAYLEQLHDSTTYDVLKPQLGSPVRLLWCSKSFSSF